MCMGTFSFSYDFPISLLIQGGSKGLTVIVLFGMVRLQNSKTFEVTFSALIDIVTF